MNLNGLYFSLHEISLASIDRDPDQPRKTFNDESIRSLAESIRSNGMLIQLPVIKQNPQDSARFIIVAGERRIRALRLIERESHPMIVVTGNVNTSRWSFVENLQREDLNPIDEAHAMKKAHEEGMTWEQVAVLSGKHVQTVYSRIKLLNLPEEIKEMVRDGRLPSLDKALSLAQYKNTQKGELIRMAHALIAGEEVLDLSARKLDRRDKYVLRHMPNSPEGLLRRVLDLGWRTKGSVQSIEMFCSLSLHEQKAAWSRLQPSTLKALADRTTELKSALETFTKVIEVLSSSPQTTPNRPVQPEQVKEVKPAVVAVADPKILPPKPRSQAQGPVVVWKKKDPAPVFSYSRSVVKQETFSDATLYVGSKVMEYWSKQIFLGGSKFLSKASLQTLLDNKEVERMVINGLKAVSAHWRSSPAEAGTDCDKLKFIQLVSRCRHDLGGRTFSEVVNFIRGRDRSPDPIDLKEI